MCIPHDRPYEFSYNSHNMKCLNQDNRESAPFHSITTMETKSTNKIAVIRLAETTGDKM